MRPNEERRVSPRYGSFIIYSPVHRIFLALQKPQALVIRSLLRLRRPVGPVSDCWELSGESGITTLFKILYICIWIFPAVIGPRLVS